MGEPQDPPSYAFAIFQRVPEPQNQLFIFLDTRRPTKNQDNSLDLFKTYYLYKSQNAETRFSDSEKTGTEKSRISV